MSISKLLINHLHLIYPPITNQEGEWLWKDAEVREYVSSSKLYMIVQRAEVLFTDYKLNAAHGLEFRLQMGNKISPLITMDIKDAITNHSIEDFEIHMELGNRLIRITDTTNDKLILWFTTNKFLFDYWRKNINVTITGDFNHREYTQYDLHYVGISKESDSFSRLFANAHHGRLKVLSNEYPKNSVSRVTDEVVLLLFDIEKTNINIAGFTSEDIDAMFGYWTTDDIAVIADAEKAFIKFLKTKYNEVKYNQYPLGKDGLFGEGLDRYCYAIQDDISLLTRTAEFVGAYDYGGICDCILIDGNNATLIKHS